MVCVDVCNWMAVSGVGGLDEFLRHKFLVHFLKCYLAVNRLNLNHEYGNESKEHCAKTVTFRLASFHGFCL